MVNALLLTMPRLLLPLIRPLKLLLDTTSKPVPELEITVPPVSGMAPGE